MKVAYFSPLPPSTSGIADYSALLVPALERRIAIEVVRPGRTRPVGDADVALYHVGNDPDAHAWIVDALRRGNYSGWIVVEQDVLPGGGTPAASAQRNRTHLRRLGL